MSAKIEVPFFSFGRNWYDFVKSVSAEQIDSANDDLQEWLGKESISGKSILDIGSGSGLHSLGFYQMGCRSLTSFDYDWMSVKSTQFLKDRFKGKDHWIVTQGSVLNEPFMQSLGKFDVVYSWGVLHHTGDMWKAIRNASQRVGHGGLFFITIYAKGSKFEEHLDMKKRYNMGSWITRKLMIWSAIWSKKIWPRLMKRKNPFAWNIRKKRGMSTYHDIVDWLGGYPYEVATTKELIDFLQPQDFSLIRLSEANEGGCHCLLFRKD